MTDSPETRRDQRSNVNKFLNTASNDGPNLLELINDELFKRPSLADQSTTLFQPIREAIDVTTFASVLNFFLLNGDIELFDHVFLAV